jgi:hypothetical protein
MFKYMVSTFVYERCAGVREHRKAIHMLVCISPDILYGF